MRPKHLLFSIAITALLPVQAQAEVKTYDLDVLRISNNTTLTITGGTRRDQPRFGEMEIADDSNASPTLLKFVMASETTRTARTDVFAGPNSFIYSRILNTETPLAGQTGTGDTEGFLQWNPLSSWTTFGGPFCKGSNEVGNPLGGPICAIVAFAQEMTIAATIPSPTYDVSLWTFDAEGDVSAEPYIWRIDGNGATNQEFLIRGHLQTNVPALSVAGMAVLGVSIMFLGARTLRRRDETSNPPKA